MHHRPSTESDTDFFIDDLESVPGDPHARPIETRKASLRRWLGARLWAWSLRRCRKWW